MPRRDSAGQGGTPLPIPVCRPEPGRRFFYCTTLSRAVTCKLRAKSDQLGNGRPSPPEKPPGTAPGTGTKFFSPLDKPSVPVYNQDTPPPGGVSFCCLPERGACSGHAGGPGGPPLRVSLEAGGKCRGRAHNVRPYGSEMQECLCRDGLVWGCGRPGCAAPTNAPVTVGSEGPGAFPEPRQPKFSAQPGPVARMKQTPATQIFRAGRAATRKRRLPP